MYCLHIRGVILCVRSGWCSKKTGRRDEEIASVIVGRQSRSCLHFVIAAPHLHALVLLHPTSAFSGTSTKMYPRIPMSFEALYASVFSFLECCKLSNFSSAAQRIFQSSSAATFATGTMARRFCAFRIAMYY